ncbi:MAG: DNA mismatch repair endonuclease MutL [Puniceicoccales bacterium]|jgi:DNA mismatch repair protein MutL|nr:DNA mismatch repair endonuclease MutL [Puniceicoccales bacterium]
MAKIHLLPETVINQIAAGEVIDRPASMVKELIENSIDARATHIAVKFNGSGDTFLSISDDGIGMDEADAAMAFERNATSKLVGIKDLESLSTFGFRGEAIASIASVARLTMQTNDGNGGTEIHYDAGKKIYQKACSCKRGTFIEIRNLFEKIPARKQFLKSASTEAMHIIRVVRAFILAKPEINFELYKNGNLLFSSPDSRDLRERTELLFGHFDQYTPLDYANDRMCLKGILFEHAVDGMVSKPEFLIFVHGRNVNNPAILRIVRDTYGMIKSRATNVGAFLFLEFKGNFVDFNVHPQKKEVRFKNDFLVKKFIEDSVGNALQQRVASLRPQEFDGKSDAPTIYAEQLSPPMQRAIAHGTLCPSFQKSSDESMAMFPGKGKENSGVFYGKYQPPPHQFFDLSLEQNLQNFPTELLQDDSSWHFVGMFWEKRFAIFEVKRGLIFVNLAAAQQCILWDKFLHSPDQLVSQLLLIPRTVTVSSEQAMEIDALLETFNSFAIGVENFGKNIYRISALPREISEEVILNLLQDPSLASGDKLLNREVFARKICSHLKFQPIEEDNVKMLIYRLLQCRQFVLSPSNINVLFEVERCDLEKKFGLQLTPKQYCH